MEAVFNSVLYTCLFSLFVLVALVCFIAAWTIRLKERKLLESGTTTVATVVSRRREEVKFSSNDEFIERRTYFRYWVCFEVRIDDQMIQKEASVSSKLFASLREGRKVPAIYPEGEPEEVRLVDEVLGSTSLKALALIGVVFLSFAGVVVGMANTSPGM